MQRINIFLQCRNGKGSRVRFTAPLPAVKDREPEGSIMARGAGELWGPLSATK